ncbi:MAG: hypothetical protein HC880_13755 [Bacteroidia bacterium]|nr:hypothetical protein [Bacteroidia bacterium]
MARWGVEAAAHIEDRAYFYYAEKVPNLDYFEALEDVSPLDTLQMEAVEDSLQERQSVPIRSMAT